MKRITAVTQWLIIAGFALITLWASAQDLPNKKALLGKAHQSYYNLRHEGLSGMECSLTPNWESMLKDVRKQDPKAADAAVKTLNQLHFVTSLAPDNSVKLTHNDLTGQSDQMMSALKQIYGGMEQMATGFFDTWKAFMLQPPFPEVNSKYQLESAGAKYKLSYKEGTTNVVTNMGRDFAITDMQITTPEFNSVIKPSFSKTPKGLRLNAYEATYQSGKAEENTFLKVFVDYQDVDGLSVPLRLNLSGTYGVQPFDIQLIFTGCQITRKQTASVR